MKADEYPTAPPVLAIEVQAPSNGRLLTKAELCLEHGAEEVWGLPEIPARAGDETG